MVGKNQKVLKGCQVWFITSFYFTQSAANSIPEMYLCDVDGHLIALGNWLAKSFMSLFIALVLIINFQTLYHYRTVMVRNVYQHCNNCSHGLRRRHGRTQHAKSSTLFELQISSVC